MGNLFVSSVVDIINEERAQSILKEVGITKRIDGFSDCLRSCHCADFKEGIEVRFDILRRVDKKTDKLKRIFVNPIKNIFLDRNFKLTIGFSTPAGLCLINNNISSIYLFVDVITKTANECKNILIHELMHLTKPIGHCDKPYCIFYEHYDKSRHNKINQIGLCEDCQKDYNILLDKINGSENDGNN